MHVGRVVLKQQQQNERKATEKNWRCLFRETWFVWITRNESPIVVQFWKGTTIAVGSIECGEKKIRPKPTNLLPLSHSRSLWFFPLLVAHNFNLSCNAKQSTTYHSISIRFVSNRHTHTHSGSESGIGVATYQQPQYSISFFTQNSMQIGIRIVIINGGATTSLCYPLPWKIATLNDR